MPSHRVVRQGGGFGGIQLATRHDPVRGARGHLTGGSEIPSSLRLYQSASYDFLRGTRGRVSLALAA